MDFQGARSYIQSRLRTELSKDLYYHGYHHTLDVVIATQKLGRLEKVTEYEMLLLQTAAWFHDAGFLSTYANHEEEGCRLSGEVLPQYDYSAEELVAIQGMIMATKVPQTPQNRLEQILCDADLEYLGGDNYYTIAESLRKELFAREILKTQKQWVAMQVKFLNMHNYFTNAAKNLCDSQKARRFQELSEHLEEIEMAEK